MAQAFILLIVLIISVIFGSGISVANVQQKIQELIVAPGKTKIEKKEKKQIAVPVFAGIKSQADVFNNLSEQTAVCDFSEIQELAQFTSKS